MRKIVAMGHWMYDGCVPMPVYIVMLDYDFWYDLAEAEESLEPGEIPQLSAQGHLFYVRFRPGWNSEDQPFWPDSPGHPTMTEAVAYAESLVVSEVNWEKSAQAG